MFNWFDITNGQSATFEIGRIYTDYDGRMAEWINEPPIHGSALAALPQFAPIHWLAADAVASYNQPYVDSGTPYQWNWDVINLDTNNVCVAGPTGVSITPNSASWSETWHPNTC